MNKPTEEQLLKNYQIFQDIVEKFLTGDRKEKVKVMLKDLEEIIVMAPASGKTWYHGAYPGGYLVHVIQVVKNALKISKMYEELGGTVDYTTEELVFSALFHDLGKLGDGKKECYVFQDNEWRRNNLQEVYVPNSELDFMLIPDRSLFILQKYGIEVNQKEWLAIKLHDGLYDDANKAYLMAVKPESKVRSNLIHVLHVADYLAAKIESDKEKEL